MNRAIDDCLDIQENNHDWFEISLDRTLRRRKAFQQVDLQYLQVFKVGMMAYHKHQRATLRLN